MKKELLALGSMGKRQKRIFPPHILKERGSLLNRRLHVILKNDVTLYGKVLEMNQEILVLKDSILKKHPIRLEEIAEIIIDQASSY